MEKIEVRNGRVHGVKTNRGDISCEVFVNCAGQVRFHATLLINYFAIAVVKGSGNGMRFISWF